MKATELIKKLQEVVKVNPEAIVFFDRYSTNYDFSGFAVDEDNNISIYVVAEDQEA